LNSFLNGFIMLESHIEEKQRPNSSAVAQSRRALSVVKYDCGFHFYITLGNYTGVTATSLQDLAQKMRTVSLDSIKFHFERGDFQRWIRYIFCDPELAERIGLISPEFSAEDLRKEIINKIESRLIQLKEIAK